MSEWHSFRALRQAADYLRAEERRWWADAIMAAIETLASESSASEQIDLIRQLHAPEDEWCNYHESARCGCIDASCEACGVSYPCPTIQVLDGAQPGELTTSWPRAAGWFVHPERGCDR